MARGVVVMRDVGLLVFKLGANAAGPRLQQGLPRSLVQRRPAAA